VMLSGDGAISTPRGASYVRSRVVTEAKFLKLKKIRGYRTLTQLGLVYR